MQRENKAYPATLKKLIVYLAFIILLATVIVKFFPSGNKKIESQSSSPANLDLSTYPYPKHQKVCRDSIFEPTTFDVFDENSNLIDQAEETALLSLLEEDCDKVIIYYISGIGDSLEPMRLTYDKKRKVLQILGVNEGVISEYNNVKESCLHKCLAGPENEINDLYEECEGVQYFLYRKEGLAQPQE